MQQQIISRQTASVVLENVAQARADVAQAFALLQGAKDRLRDTMGQGPRYYDSLFEHRISDYGLDRSASEADQHIARNTWRYLLDLMGITGYMTEARQKELTQQLEKGDFPELTLDNVLSTLSSLANRSEDLLHESVREVFNWLRPRHELGVGKLKTNSPFKVGYKVVIGGAVERWYSDRFHINPYREPNFRSLGNALTLLDGQGVKQRPNDLLTQLDEGLKTAESGGRIHTVYFEAKPYKNGNLHVEFTRHDLIDQMNVIGANGARDLPRA